MLCLVLSFALQFTHHCLSKRFSVLDSLAMPVDWGTAKTGKTWLSNGVRMLLVCAGFRPCDERSEAANYCFY